MNVIFLNTAILLATIPLTKTLEIQASLVDTVTTIVINEEVIAEALKAEILEHEIHTARPRWIINGKSPRISWLLEGTLKLKAKLPIAKEPVVIEFKEIIEIGEHFIYKLEAKESDLINQLDTRVELWEEDGVTRGKAELWIDLKVKYRWTSLFGRVMLSRLNRVINNLVNPPEPIEEEKPPLVFSACLGEGEF